MFRFPRVLKIGVLAALVAAAFTAGSARATVIDSDQLPLVGTVGTPSIYFERGAVEWSLADGTLTPDAWGTLTMDNAKGYCARIRMEYFQDNVSVAVRYGGSVCPNDGGYHTYSVGLDPYSNPDIDLVKVSVEKQSGGSDFSIIESFYSSPNTHANSIQIPGKGADFGGPTWSVVSAQPNDGTLYWNRANGAEYTARLMGYIWLNNMGGVCARMNLRYYDESGALLTEKHGGSVCASDNSIHAYSVDLQPYTSSEVVDVEAQLQTQGTNGSWNVVGSSWGSIHY
jgi:hypothetical protein